MSDKLQTGLGYDFKRTALLRQAITHSSFAHEQSLNAADCNQRLEFLGDAVLELCVSDFLYHTHPELAEGELSRRRASLVCETTLAEIARQIGLGDYLLLGQGEAQENGRKKDSILSDAMEAIFGAIFLDGGMDAVRNVILTLVGPIAAKSVKKTKDNKSTLQEILQKNSKETAVYKIVEETGPSHQKRFVAEVTHKGIPLGRGIGRNKKEAEQNAAAEALKKLKNK